VPEYKKLGEAIAKDPSLKNRVVIAKVGCRRAAVTPLWMIMATATRYIVALWPLYPC
jgi:hypothetical protein